MVSIDKSSGKITAVDSQGLATLNNPEASLIVNTNDTVLLAA